MPPMDAAVVSHKRMEKFWQHKAERKGGESIFKKGEIIKKKGGGR